MFRNSSKVVARNIGNITGVVLLLVYVWVHLICMFSYLK